MVRLWLGIKNHGIYGLRATFVESDVRMWCCIWWWSSYDDPLLWSPYDDKRMLLLYKTCGNNKIENYIQIQLYNKPQLPCCCCSVTTSNSLGPHGLQHTRFLWPQLPPRVCWNSSPLSLWCYLIISLSPTPSPFALSLSQYQGLFQCIGCPDQVSKVLELQRQSFQWVFRVDFP